MQKKWIATIVIPVIVCLVGFKVGCSQWTSESFELIKAIPLVGWTIEYVAVPDDYNSPLISVPVYELPVSREFTCKYSGRHLVCIRNIEDRKLENSGVGLQVKVRDKNGKLMFCKEVCDVPIFSRGDGRGYNFHYCYFEVPGDLPKSRTLHMEITSYGNTNAFLKCYPTSKVEVLKMVDK